MRVLQCLLQHSPVNAVGWTDELRLRAAGGCLRLRAPPLTALLHPLCSLPDSFLDAIERRGVGQEPGLLLVGVPWDGGNFFA